MDRSRKLSRFDFSVESWLAIFDAPRFEIAQPRSFTGACLSFEFIMSSLRYRRAMSRHKEQMDDPALLLTPKIFRNFPA